MNLNNNKQLGSQIMDKAIDLGAALAGIVNIEDLKKSPSHKISEKLADFGGVGVKDVPGKKRGQVEWPDKAKSAVVIAVTHPRDCPDLDYWVKGLKGGTKGNAQLMAILSKLAKWLEMENNTHCIKIPYHIEHGGVYMKDSAVLAGLGCIGKNNILITPQYGPRIRLRVMLLETDLPSTGMIDFDPCKECKEYCKQACPQKALEKKIYSAEELGQKELPGRTGVYNRVQCNVQMEKNSANGKDVEIEDSGIMGNEVRFCRRCELACPVGQSG